MKSTKRIMFLFCVLICNVAANPGIGGGGGGIIINAPLKFNSQTPDIIGPFDSFCSPQTISFEYTSTNGDLYKESLEIYDLSNESFLYYAPSTYHYYSSTYKTVTFKVEIPFHYYFSNNGLKMVVSIIGKTDDKKAISKTLTLYPIVHEKIYSTQYKDRNYTIANRVGSFLTSYDTNETFTFSKTESVISNDTRNRLRLDNIVFGYSYLYAFTCSNAYLTTSDPKNVFPYISKNNGIRTIPISIKSGQYLSFVYNKLYVNPDTLEMSSSYKNGFIETNDFYLPLGKEEELSYYPFEILINHGGGNDIEIHIPLTYQKNIDLFDHCVTSDFCVSGGIKE